MRIYKLQDLSITQPDRPGSSVADLKNYNYAYFTTSFVLFFFENQLCDLQPYKSSRCGKETGERGKTLARSIMIIITASSYDVTFFSLF